MLRRTMGCLLVAVLAAAFGNTTPVSAETAQNTFATGRNTIHQILVDTRAEMMASAQECSAAITALLADGEDEQAQQMALECTWEIREQAREGFRGIEDNRTEIVDKLGEYLSLATNQNDQIEIQSFIDQIEVQAETETQELLVARRDAVDLIRNALNGE